ncbi:hypothetical protein M408DRAFT_333772 [Serendipita vermifera MAFF 305830]|uniref:Actin-like ATPase domain-containing protein n=1 Tax=Serendipita vermifera MAFF 305830 TaxID=933852 RepID=A0A0C3ALF4_SERVB|nr:hypothetical protein M408DRAFT_333772 [Serendipita vermifera MAFF 305830]
MAGYIGDKKYTGTEKIVIGVDIGTTQSAVSFAYLYPDSFTRVRMVNKWPGQPESVGSSKIPTLVAYRNGQCKACGAEALEYVDESAYTVAKWFKLHLHPSSMRTSDLPPPYGSRSGSSSFEVPPLPPSVSIGKVYADFMKYLIDNTQVAFEQSTPNGAAIWRRLKDTMIILFTTPNGWDLTQQDVLRKAAISAGMVPTEEKAYDLLDFVTEGEASVHYALAYTQTEAWLSVNSVFAVIDAGGSTVDSTLYECTSTEPKVLLEEVCPSECIQAGGVFVDRAAQAILEERLRGTSFGSDECITDMVTAFEARTKRLFDDTQNSYVVDFGGSRDTDRARGIIKGKLSMTRTEVRAAFDDVIKRIMDNCSLLLRGRKVQHILLVGGFGESAYLQKRLAELFDIQGVKVVTVEEPAKKAAAEGALIWFIKQTVLARISRVTIGVPVGVRYDSYDPEHAKRSLKVYIDAGGEVCLPGGFSTLVPKGTKMESGYVATKPYIQRFSCRISDSGSHLGSFERKLMVWEGEGIPIWREDVHGRQLSQVRTLCTLKAELSALRSSLKEKGPSYRRYCEVEFDIVVRFGGTQLQARMQWKEHGVLREGPISILPKVTI